MSGHCGVIDTGWLVTPQYLFKMLHVTWNNPVSVRRLSSSELSSFIELEMHQVCLFLLGLWCVHVCFIPTAHTLIGPNVWSPWKPDLVRQHWCVGEVVWRAAKAADWAGFQVADLWTSGGPLWAPAAVDQSDSWSIKSKHWSIQIGNL